MGRRIAYALLWMACIAAGIYTVFLVWLVWWLMNGQW